MNHRHAMDAERDYLGVIVALVLAIFLFALVHCRAEGQEPPESTEQHPSVTFAEPGEYTVTLVACNAWGCDEATKTITIYPRPEPCPPGAPATIDLTDHTVTGDETYTARERISATEVTVEAGGSLTLTAPRVALGGGVAISGKLTVRRCAP